MDLKVSWYSILATTLTLSGLAGAAEVHPKSELKLNESESQIVMCGLYHGYRASIPEDSTLAQVCKGNRVVSELSKEEKAILKDDVVTFSKRIQENSGSTAI